MTLRGDGAVLRKMEGSGGKRKGKDTRAKQLKNA